MPKFKALITRDCTESVEIEIEAPNKGLAIVRALEKARADFSLVWVPNDGSGDEPYFGDEDEDVQEITDAQI